MLQDLLVSACTKVLQAWQLVCSRLLRHAWAKYEDMGGRVLSSHGHAWALVMCRP